MLRASSLVDLRAASPDYESTEQLKAFLRDLKDKRTPFYLTKGELDLVLKWKLGSQYGRASWLWDETSPRLVKRVTTETFLAQAADWEALLERQVKSLTRLRGVGIGVASAALALILPDEYAVIDFRGWRQLFGEDRRSFSISNYKNYMRAVRRLSAQLDWSPQEVDLAIWELDRRMFPVLRRSAHS